MSLALVEPFGRESRADAGGKATARSPRPLRDDAVIGLVAALMALAWRRRKSRSPES